MSKLQILLIGVLMAAASLLTHLYEEHAWRMAIQQNAFRHAAWTSDKRSW
jgi:hypothetical protein